MKKIFALMLFYFITSFCCIKAVSSYFEDDIDSKQIFEIGSKSKGDDKFDNYIKKFIIDSDGNIFQLCVRDQFDPGCGGSGSSGYHALKNGIYLACALKDSEKSLRLLNMLSSGAEIKRILGYPPFYGYWRSLIINSRKSECNEGLYLKCKDIANLIKYEQRAEDGLLHKIPGVGFTVLPSLNSLNSANQILSIVRMPKLVSENFIHVFIINAKVLLKNKLQNPDYWIAIVAKKKSSNLTFYVVNSYKNELVIGRPEIQKFFIDARQWIETSYKYELVLKEAQEVIFKKLRNINISKLFFCR